MSITQLWWLFFIYLMMDGRWPRLRGAEVKFDLHTTPEDNLRMRAGVPFKVALFADLHFGENAWTDWGPLQDVKSMRVMSTVLDKEQPDFVVYLGDVITANNIMVKNASLYWDQAISPTRESGISWCTVFGNHDDAPFEWPMEWFSEAGIPPLDCPVAKSVSSGCGDCSFQGTTRTELMQSEIQKKGSSYSKSGPHDLRPSVSNYALKILSADSQRAVAYFYFFDSGGGSYPEVISNAQVKWFEKKSGNLNPDSSVPELIFWHIPTESYREVAPKYGGSSNCIGSIFAENVAVQEAEMGIMHVLKQRSSVKAVFVGHNHGLDWCCPHKHLWLCFARHTGYGGYGNWSRGARILEINEHPFSLKSWITMEDGTSHSEVILSS